MPVPTNPPVTGTGVQEVGFGRIAVLGLGLIGGSLLRRLATAPPSRTGARYDTIGYDSDPRTRRTASAAGHAVAATIADAVAGADLVVLATPLSAFPDLLADLADIAHPDAAITDVASVKVPVRDAVRLARLGPRYVGGHPMAGTERSGFEASDPNLFDGAAWVLCVEPDTDLARWLALARLVTGLGCRVVPTSALAHDLAVARISGLPHLLAAVLATVGAAGGLGGTLAAGSFRDGTRVAGTRPDLAAMLCDANRDAVAEALEDTLERLSTARDLLRAGASVLPVCSDGHAVRQRWLAGRAGDTTGTEAAGQDSVQLDSADPTLRDQLGMLGAAGGHVRALDGPVLHCWRPGRA